MSSQGLFRRSRLEGTVRAIESGSPGLAARSDRPLAGRGGPASDGRLVFAASPPISAAKRDAMIYLLAIFLPPLGLLLNGQPFSALVNAVLIVPCILLGLAFPLLFLVPSAHAVIAIYMRRDDRKHREIVEAIEKHGMPPKSPN
jgi:hypothetical protein